MDTPRPTIDFEHKGIGQALSDKAMRVPLNQREYAWEDMHVEDLFRDLADAERSDETEYFLGMIVLTPGPDGIPLIADGQQRLATTSILLAAMRDFLVAQGETKTAQQFDDRFLQTAELGSEETEPKLRLNVADDEFFRKRILSSVDSEDRAFQPTKLSHRLIDQAATLAAKHVLDIVAGHSRSKQVEILVNSAKFIRERARVILVTAPDEHGAFRMFETLNDRGVEAAQSDLVKNYLLGKSGNRMAEVQQRWASMVGVLESVSDDKIIVTYLRHFFILDHGHIREHQLFGKIREKVQGKTAAISTDALANTANDYIALRLPQHEKWNTYGTATSRHIQALQVLRVEQIRPLLLAVARNFSVAEAQKAFRLFVSWGVRFVVGGGSRVGRIDREYAERATKVGTGKIKTTKDLARDMAEIIPSDAEFEANFSLATISRADLARYVLRSLELKHKGSAEPEQIPNDDERQINLEHILPVSPGPEWHIEPEEAAKLYKRIGNLALLKLSENQALGSGSFAEKSGILKKSTFALTALAGAQSEWTAETIAERQKMLAQIAVETWPISVS